MSVPNRILYAVVAEVAENKIQPDKDITLKSMHGAQLQPAHKDNKLRNHSKDPNVAVLT